MRISRLLALGPVAWVVASVGVLESAPAQAAEASAPRYLVQNLGNMPRGKGLAGRDINNAGMVIGTYSTFGSGNQALPFLWSNGQLQSLESADAVKAGYAFKMNNAGDSVGYRTVSFSDGGGRATLYSQGRVIDLTPALGGRRGSGFAINDVGQIAGSVGDGRRYRSFLLDEQGLRFIENPVGQVLDMNNSGTILLTDSTLVSKQTRAFLYREGSEGILLGSVNEPLSMVALNDAGQVAGSRDGRAFIYSNGTFDFLPAPEGFITQATDINSQGWVIGQMGTAAEPWLPQNFLYRDGRMFNLEDLMLPFGARKFSDIDVVAINDRGQILGVGYYNGMHYRTFVATPVPESGTGALWLAGLGLLGWVARRHRAAAAPAHPAGSVAGTGAGVAG